MVDFIPDTAPVDSRFVLDEPAQRFIPDKESVFGSGVAKAKLAYQEVGRFLDESSGEALAWAEKQLGPIQFTAPKLRALAAKAPDKAARVAERTKEIEETKARIAATEPQYDPENPITSTAKRAASTAIGLLGEIPLFMVGGGPAGTAAKAATSGLVKIAPKTAKAASAALTQAGAFAGEAGLRGQSPEEIAAQGATGAAFGTAGQVAPRGLKTIAEGLVFIGAEKLKGHDLEAKDYGEILGILVGMKTVGKAYQKVTDTAVDIKKAAAISRSRAGMTQEKVKMAEEVMTSPEGKALIEEALKRPEEQVQVKEKPRVLTEPTPGIEPSAVAQRALFEGPTIPERLAAASKANIEARVLKNKARIRAIREEHKAAMDAAVKGVPLTPEEIVYKSDYSLKPSLREEALVKLQEIFPGTTPMERLSLLRERQKQVVPEKSKDFGLGARVTEDVTLTDLYVKGGALAPAEVVSLADRKAAAIETVKAWEPISRDWTADPTAETGRPTHYYGIERGNFSTRKAEVILTVTESGTTAYNARTADGRDLGTYPTPREAMQAVSDAVALPTTKPPGVPPSQRGAIDPELLLPKPIRMGIERVNKDVKAVLDTLKVYKEFTSNRKQLEAEYDDLAKFNKFIAFTHGLLQVRELNKNLPWLNDQVDAVRSMHQITSARLQVTKEHILAWQALGKDQAGKVYETMVKETLDKRVLTPEELSKYKLSAEALLVRQKIKADYARFLDDAEHLLRLRAAGRLEGPALDAELKGITEDFTALRSKPYTPLSRWGKLLVVAKRGDKTLEVKNFANELAARWEEPKMAARYAKDRSVNVTRSYVPDSVISLQNMPPRIAERMVNELLKDPTLSPKQAADIRESLNNLIYRLSPEASWRKHLLERKGTAGFSWDGIRAYASYMQHGTNHLARLQFGDILSENINRGNLAAKALQKRGVSNVDYLKLVEWMEHHRQYIMNPKNEWAAARSASFIVYLGFLPKAAFVNLTQTPMVTLPYLAARYGDGAALGSMLKAMKDVPMSSIKNKKVLSKEEVVLFDRLAAILDESFASHVGATAEGGILNRALATNALGRGFATVAEKAPYLFQIAEGYNRRVTALATYRLARGAGLNEEAAISTAQKAVEDTQFEYASWNRPVFMRGKPSILTVFMQYIQNMLFFLARDPGAVRALVLLAGAAGIQGLPFMEDILDMLDRTLSTPNNKFDSRKEVRAAAVELGINPDFAMHGTAHFGLGLPYVDMSGSMSLGRPIRLTEPLLRQTTDFKTQFSDTAQDALGAAISYPIEMWKFVAGTTPDTGKAMERILPGFARGPVQAYKALTDEVIKIKGGKDISMPTDDLDTWGKAAAMVTGFQLQEATAERERVFAINETKKYYEARHKALMDNYEYALNIKSPEGIKDAGKAIAQYNREVPFKTYAISIRDLQSSLKQKAMRNALEEAGLVGSKMGADVVIEYAPAFPK